MSRKSKKNKNKNRELAALLSYGPQYIPYTAAWTDSRIMQVRAFKTWTYVAIDRIATKVCHRAPNVSQIMLGTPSEPALKALNWLLRRKALTRSISTLQPTEYLKPVRATHPLVRLMRDPNLPDTGWDLWYETVMFLLLTGNAYWWTPRGPLGLPNALWVLPSHWVWPVQGADRLIDAYELRPVEGNYLKITLPADEVIHFKKKSPISKIDGYAPLTACANWHDVEESVYTSQQTAYKNGVFPTVSVQFDGTMNDPTTQQLARIEQKFLARYAQEMNSNRPLFLPPGVSVKPLSIKPNEMVFGETIQNTRDNILSEFGVPKAVVGLTQDEDPHKAQQVFCGQTINPICEYLGQVITEKLAWQYDDNLRVWWEDFTPDDPRQLNEDIKTDALVGGISTNEVRILRGREPWPEDWANKPIMPVNMQPGSLALGGDHADPLPGQHQEQPRINPEDQ